MPDDMSEAARWQERKQHWISQGIHPSIAGELAWRHMDVSTEGPETLDQARRADAVAKTAVDRWEPLPAVSDPS